MAQTQKAPKQPQDPYAQRAKSLTSTVQRLRGWVGSDPSRAPELADALVELTEHRLLGHGYARAAADAQESVRLAVQLWSASGPIGPYASLVDASRCVTSLVHVASVQVGMGRPEAAGQTVQSVQDLQQQLRGVGLQEQLTPTTDVWLQSCTARAALAAGDIASANVSADAALARLVESGLRDDTDAAFVAIDVDRLVSDCRWAAGSVQESLAHLHAAKDRYDVFVGRLQDSARLSPALVERLAEPLFGLHRDLADRLLASGEVDHALTVRRSLVELLERLVVRLGEPVRLQLALSLVDLAGDLLTADRVDEAEAAAAQAQALTRQLPSSASPRLLAATAHGLALTRAGRSGEALPILRPLVSAKVDKDSSAVQAVALLALAEALRAEGDLDAAETTERTVDELVEALSRSSGGSIARTALQDLARGVVSRGVPTGSSAAEVANKELRETAAWLEAERAEAHRLEVARMERARVEAERVEAERAAAERAAAEQAEAERVASARAERLEAERQAAAEEAEAIERKRRREERLEEHRLEAERLEAERQEAERLEVERLAAERLAAEPDELAVAQQEWVDAKDLGDRRRARAANERVVELLRPHAQANLADYGPQLRQALEELSSARLRGGDLFGSRAVSKEARALARSLGG